MVKILFTGGGGAGTGALVSLLNNKYELHFADSQQDKGAIPPQVEEKYQHNIPWAYEANFVDYIVDLIEQLGISYFVPTVDEELFYLSKIQERLPSLSILAPDSEYISKMIDKRTMGEALAEKNLPHPGSHELDKTDQFNFPVIVKPRLGRGSRGVQLLSCKEDITAYLQLAKKEKHQFVIQNYLSGTEFTVMMSANYLGELCAIVPVRVDDKKGITISAEVVNDPLIVKVCSEIHAQYKTKGCYNIQLMKIDDNTAIPFEINPRVSTTFCLALAAGIDPIANYKLKKTIDTLQPLKNGFYLKRYWNNFIFLNE